MTQRVGLLASLVFAAVAAPGCNTELQVAENFSAARRATDSGPLLGDAAASSQNSGDSGARLADAAVPPRDAAVCAATPCQGKARACSNCKDDDQDGLTDAEDPDCWGACDDDETVLSSRKICPTAVCFFDANCGAGNDDTCLGFTPFGCDCHGCCEVFAQAFSVQLGEVPGQQTDCDSATLLDEQACPRCEIDSACHQPCVEGARCFGAPR